ncbi:ADP-ribosylglycohydrolase family protein [Candidatus Bathyarchaeota archaeon]|nr:ADP-ribosylglycohydrolase family protein [Candidatus Bathyarchaeota archaeon]MBS7628171.1 ADP-ribosylglycohydrolase family protein [Candidatus Bathyarchaeota archaeon]
MLKNRTPEALEDLLEDLASLQPSPDFPYTEPLELEAIKAMRPIGLKVIQAPPRLSEEELYDRLYGGWLGRCAGCLLGKPVEGWSREKIERYLRLADAYPLSNYFPAIKPVPVGYPPRMADSPCLLGNIDSMPRDDDIDYTMIGLHILETYGASFRTEDVGEAWLSNLPYKKVYTAERVAYRNLINGLKPPKTALYRNPYREWIGAQIRADIWGYVTPGFPELAAELAYKDAILSHVKNGVYGEMFVSSMISAAFTTKDVEEIVSIGLSMIPARCRLAEAVKDVVEWSRRYRDWRDTWTLIMQKYGHYHPVHVINNAALVLMGLLYGKGDFEKTITISVMGGLDTDCNGATAGSILGIMLGAKGLPSKWTMPLRDVVHSEMAGFEGSRISNLARRTLIVAKRMMDEQTGSMG